MEDAKIDKHLNAILNAAGSALRHYSFPKSRADMRAAMKAALDEAQGEGAKAVEDLRARVAELEAELSSARAAPEPIQCETCQGTGKINETLGGHSFSDPSATCPDCDGSGEIESIHDFRASQWWVKELDGIWGSTSPHVTPDQKRAVAVVHNLLRHVANLGQVTVTTNEAGRVVAVTRQDAEHHILSVIWEAPPNTITPEQSEKADAAIREALGDAYDCMRAWSAWERGTMSNRDFWLVAESDERVAEIRNAAAAALGFEVGA